MPNDTLLAIVIVIGSVLVSMTLHEAMHAFASYWLGDDTAKYEGRLTLNPLAHIDPVTTVALPVILVLMGLPPFGAAKPVPFNPHRLRFDEFGAAIVGVIGPLTNFLLAVVAALVFRLIDPSGMLAEIIITFVLVNLGFFVFNMIPWPPLDGSRLLYAFAPESVQDLMRRIEAFGLTGIFMFMFVLLPIIRPALERIDVALLNFLLG